MATKDLLKAAEAWVRGDDVDWDAIQSPSSAEIVSAPTYPFEKRRFWIEGARRQTSAVPPSVQPRPEVRPTPKPTPNVASVPTATPTEPPVESRAAGKPAKIRLAEPARVPQFSASQSRPPVVAKLRPTSASTPSSAPLDLRARLAAGLARHTHSNPELLKRTQSFEELGVDSLVVVEWTEELNAEFDTALAPTDLSACTNLERLHELLVSTLGTRGAAPVVESPAPTPKSVETLRAETAPTGPERPADSEAGNSAEPLAPSVRSGPSRAELQRALVVSLADALYMEPHEIDVEQPFTEMGLDSIVGVEWIHGLNRKYGVSIEAIMAYDYPNIQRFTQLMEQELGKLAGPGSLDAAGVSGVEAGSSAPAVPDPEPAGVVAAAPTSDDTGPHDVVRSLAEALFKQPEAIDVGASFAANGLDPLVAEAWLERVERMFGTALRVSDLERWPSVAAFVDFIDAPGEMPEAAPRGAEAKTPDSTHSQPRQVEPPAPRPSKSRVESSGEPIAIVGVSGRYPGADDLDGYWDNLVGGRSSICEVPPERWNVHDYYDPTPGAEGRVYAKWIGMVDGVDRFDASFFRMSPAEAAEVDPQHRLFLQEAYRAFEHAGYASSSLDGVECGVYLGIINQDYRAFADDGASLLEKNNSHAMAAARVSYCLNLKGPALPVDTACSSSLVGIHLACQALRSAEIDVALVGGVTLYLGVEGYLEMCAAGMLAADGRCKTFDDDADGFVPGEGVGAVVLKRLSDAQADGDDILATIVATGVNQDGKTNGITAPSAQSQAKLLRDVYARFDIDPASISYVETHGTGTKLGDPIELSALASAFEGPRAERCAIGSVKTNIGHTSGAAGVAGVHKAVLCLRNRTLVPSLNFERPNQHFDFEASPFYVNTEHRAWSTPEGVPRRAAVSSFGFSGTNAHVVLEEYVDKRTRPGRDSGHPMMFPLSAKTPEQLRRRAEDLLRFVDRGDVRAPELAYTLQVGRDAMPARLAFVASSLGEVATRLRDYLEGRGSGEVYEGTAQTSGALLPGFTADEDAAELLLRWTDKGKLEPLLRAWVGGFEVDWNRLYEDAERPFRVGAPTYPFAEERHWLDARAPKQGAMASLHPLVHENTSTLQGQRFTSTFTGTESFCRDHRVDGECILPAAAHIEMVRAALALSDADVGADETLTLRDVVWGRPIRLSGAPTRVHVELESSEAGEVSFRVGGDAAGVDGVGHCHGVVGVGSDRDARELDLTEIRARLQSMGSGAGLYDGFARCGLDYGPTHRVLDQVFVGEREVLAKVVAPPQVLADPPGMVLHPALLDGALQSIGAFGTDALRVPFAFDRLRVSGAWTDTMWVWARRTEAPDVFDLVVVDERGRACLEIQGLVARAVPRPAKFDTQLFVPVWCDIPADISADRSREFVDHHVISIPRDAEFSVVATEVFECLQQISRSRPSGDVAVQVVVPASPAHRPFLALGALLRTAQLEDARIWGQLVVTDERAELDSVLERCRRLPPGFDVHIEAGRWRVLRYDGAPKPEPTAGPLVDGTPWKTGGVYLITGGAGGLGSLFAREIADRVQTTPTRPVRVVLAGRSAAFDPSSPLAEALRRSGAVVEHRRCDVSVRDDVRTLIAGVVADHGSIAGILHCAGVVRDGLLRDKSRQDFEAVLAAKVRGFDLLLEAAAELDSLDFIVAFSSGAAVLGNFGQADYAVANAYMDAVARSWQRPGVRCLSIGWPLWSEGGMGVDAATAAAMRERLGLVPMDTAAGLQAFYAALASSEPHVVVLHGEPHRLLENVRVGTERRLATPIPAKTESPSGATGRAQARAWVREQLSTVLRLSAERIGDDQHFEDFGIDSILAMRLTTRLETHLGRLPKTLFFEYQTLASLADHLADSRAEALARVLQPPGTPAATSPIPTRVEQRPAPKRSRRPTATGLERGSVESAGDAGPGPHGGSVSPLDIAIVGVAGRYPGARTLPDFWANLRDGRDCVTEVPADRWDWRRFHDERDPESSEHLSKWGGFISDVDRFDPRFFNISPREAQTMDPQERLFLEHAWLALEDAAIRPEDLRRDGDDGLGARVGVYAGVMYENYQWIAAEQAAQGNSTLGGGSYASIANRVSFALDLHGPSMTIDTMCSSSLTTIDLACRELQAGRISAAIAGGVNLTIHPNKYRVLTAGRFMSPRGRCESFGRDGAGYIPGEGVGVLVLKRLADARRDGDRIHAVIRGSAINHGGKTHGYSVPNPNAQADVVRQALDEAQVDPRALGYIEAHGTGTKLGDPIELVGLNKALTKGGPPRCWIGSVKSNIGHCESAAGVAAVTKVLLQLRAQEIAGSLHSTALNEYIDFGGFTVNTRRRAWPRPIVDGREHPRVAGVSSFGAGGSNAHLVLQEYVDESVSAVEDADEAVVIVVSARRDDRLRPALSAVLEHVVEHFGEPEGSRPRLLDLAYTLQQGRVAHEARCALVVRGVEDLVAGLHAALEGDDRPGVFWGQREPGQLAPSVRAEVQRALADRDLATLASSWAAGASVDWSSLYEGRQPRRIAAPHYPFARERYWIGVEPGRSEARVPASTAPASLPARPVSAAPRLTLPAMPERDGFSASNPPAKPSVTLSPLPSRSAAPPAPVAQPMPVAASPATDAGPAPDALVRPVPRVAELEDALAESLARALFLDPSEIERTKPFVELGLDSIVGVEWMEELRQRYGIPLDATDVYAYPSVAAFAGRVADKLRADRRTSKPAPETTRSTSQARGTSAPPAVRAAEPPARDVARLEAELSQSLAAALFLEPSEIRVDAPFVDLGVDSIVAVEWINGLNRQYGVCIDATEVYGHPDVASVARLIARRSRGVEASPTPRAEVTPLEPPRIRQPSGPSNPSLPGRPGPSAIEPNAKVEVEVETTGAQPGGTSRSERSGRGPIAIIGMSGRYPDSADLEQYWANLAQGRCSIREVPASRWKVAEYFDPERRGSKTIYCKWLGALDDIECFDAPMFRVSPAEAEDMDPQHRLFMEQGYAAFQRAGYSAASLAGTQCGVYLGIMSNEYASLARAGNGPAAGISNSFAIGAGRLPYFLDLKGPAIPVDTACSSSLVATHLACQALREGELDLALVGGVTLYLTPESYLGMCAAGMLSPQGLCKTFDDGADGFVPGEGVGAVVLKRLADAERDGDHILGTIIGSGINQDGRTNGITAPNGRSQAELLQRIYARHDIDPASISHVEAHGTGTKLGDPVELKALASVFERRSSSGPKCALGSVKSNIGHTSAASGMASLHKVLLSMRERTLVPSLHFQTPNRHFDFEASPFRVNTERRGWEVEGDQPRRAAVSSFGFSGTNAHIVVEEYRSPRPAPQAGPVVVPLSARTEAGLREAVEGLLAFVEGPRVRDGQVGLADLAYTMQVGRDGFDERIGFVCSSFDTLREQLRSVVADGASAPGIVRGQAARGGGELAELLGDDDFARTVQEWVGKEKLEPLLRLWVRGADLDWSRLHVGRRLRRVEAPTTPYARDRHWVPAPESSPASVGSATASIEESPVPEAPRSPDLDWDGVSYEAVWEARAPRDRRAPPAATADEVLAVVYDSPGSELARQLVQRAAEHGVRAVPVLLGDETRPAAGDQPRVVAMDSTSDLASEMVEIGLVDRVCFVYGSIGPKEGDRPEIALLGLAKWLEGSGRHVDLHVVTVDNHRDGGPASSSGGALTGLAYAIAQSSHRIRVRNTDVASEDILGGRAQLDQVARAILAEPATRRGEVVALRDGGRLERAFVPLQWGELEGQGLRHGGTYVLVGGSGHVGRVVTRFLLERYAARVYWIGRRGADDPSVVRAIEEATRQGRGPRYVRADVTDAASMRRAVETIVETSPRIDGVVFSAMVFSMENSFVKTSESEFRAILEVKSQGTRVCHRAFEHLQLDFMCFFSSAQSFSFSGAAQLSAYAAGTTDSDAYVASVRESSPFPVGTINFGFWRCALHDAPASMRNVEALDDAEGFACFERFVSAGLSRRVLYRVVCMKASDDVRALMGVHEDQRVHLGGPAPASAVPASFAEPTADPEAMARRALWPEFERWMLRLAAVQLTAAAGVTPSKEHLVRWHAESLRLVAAAADPALVEDGRELWPRWEAACARWRRDPHRRAQVALVDACLRAVPRILAGEVEAEQVLFPDASSDLVEGIYRDNPVSDAFNRVQAEAVVACIRARRRDDPAAPIRILEVGAGTGGSTAGLLALLDAERISIEEYAYTDLSRAFLMHGEQVFGPRCSVLRTHRFDVEQPLRGQGIEEGRYDVVIATNVLHATANVREALRNVKACLRPGGALVLNEIGRHSVFAHLTFGLLSGWWRCEDVALRVPGCPALAPERWRHVLVEEGYFAVAFPASALHRCGQQVVVAHSDGRVRQRLVSAPARPEPAAVRAPSAPEVGAGGQGRVAAAVRDALQSSLKIAAAELRDDVAFSDYGMDSILGVRFVEQVSESLNVDLNPAVIFEYSTVAVLAAYIAETFGAALEAASESVAETTDPLERVGSSVQTSATVPGGVASGATGPGVDGPSDIAIIGFSAQTPGCLDAYALWDRLVADERAEMEVVLEHRDRFDAEFFGIADAEAERMSRHQRLVLQEGWKALEDAACDFRALDGRPVGVFVGAEPLGEAPGESFAGGSDAIIASRLSYHLNLRGPAMVVNTACSSSGAAIHLACESLRSTESTMALAGGVFAGAGAEAGSRAAGLDMISAGGRCRSFDAAADGTVMTEGVGFVVLKRLADALADGDPVHGVIRGSGWNQDGASNGILSPNGLAEEQLIRRVHERFDIDPADIDYVEAHATGTRFGDAVEVNAVSRAFRGSGPSRSQPCVLGTVKPRVGHTAAAAGVIGLIKVLLSMKDGLIPGVEGLETVNPMIELDGSTFAIARDPRTWSRNGGRARVAGLNTFGHSGTNVHLVVSELVRPEPHRVGPSDSPVVVPLSAADDEALRHRAQDLLRMLDPETTARRLSASSFTLDALAHTLQVGRRDLEVRVAFVVDTLDELAGELKSFVEGRARTSTCAVSAAPTPRRDTLVRVATSWLGGESVDWERLRETAPPTRLHLPVYVFGGSDRRAPVSIPPTSDAATGRDGSVPAALPVERARARLRALVARQLEIPVTEVGEDRSFFDLGMTSAGLAQSSAELQDWVGAKFLPSTFFQYPSIRALAQHLVEVHPRRFDVNDEPGPERGPERGSAPTDRARRDDVSALLSRLEAGALGLDQAIALIESERTDPHLTNGRSRPAMLGRNGRRQPHD